MIHLKNINHKFDETNSLAPLPAVTRQMAAELQGLFLSTTVSSSPSLGFPLFIIQNNVS
jgi:hypothetical protein